MVVTVAEQVTAATQQRELQESLYLASVTQRVRLQLYDLNYGAIQITYLLTYLRTTTGTDSTTVDNTHR